MGDCIMAFWMLQHLKKKRANGHETGVRMRKALKEQDELVGKAFNEWVVLQEIVVGNMSEQTI